MIEKQAKPVDLIGRYVELRDELRAADANYAAWKKEHFDDPMNSIEMQLLDQLNMQGVESFRTRKGTAYKKKAVSLTTADGAEFRRHVVGLEAWELINFVPNKTAVNELVDNGEPVPPGLNYSTRYNVSINRPKEDK
jgi:hypothetical protein